MYYFFVDMDLLKMTKESARFLWRNPRYVGAGFVLLVAVLYHFFVAVPAEDSKKGSKSSQTQEAVADPDLNAKNLEKTYPNVFQSQVGDVFRVGVVARNREEAKISVFARSSLSEPVKVGEWIVTPSEEGKFYEAVFTLSGRYSDIALRLEPEGSAEEQKWRDSDVFLDSFFVTRVDARTEAEMKAIAPTKFGLFGESRVLLAPDLSAEKQEKKMQWVFRAENDFVTAVEFGGKTIAPGPRKYVFELFLFDTEKKESVGKHLQTGTFTPDMLVGMQTLEGNYRLDFPVVLEAGKSYIMTLTPSENSDKGEFALGTVQEMGGAAPSRKEGDSTLVLVGGSKLHTDGNVELLDRARLEDIGKSSLYSFILQGSESDYFNLFSASGSVHFDKKKKLVVGGQGRGEYLVYRFDMVRPFDRFALEAEQSGNDENEMKLEYSFDNAFWRAIDFKQKKDEPQQFALSIPGNGENRVVYVRATYNGEEKKSGYFALKKLSVTALVPNEVKH